MKTFLKCEDFMFDPNLVQSVKKEYSTSCIVTFENGTVQQIDTPYEKLCKKIEETVSKNAETSLPVLNFSTEKKRGKQYGY